MNEAHFLWPVNQSLKGLQNSYKLVSVEQVETKLQSMFTGGYPVLCSSGRAALFMAVNESDVSRKDAVGIFPYASHCVLDAVSRIATPLTGPSWISADLRIVYHQWGYVQEKQLPSNTIEDCADTLCVPGTELFPGGGSFEIWSLPKILGTTSGGVLWCRDEKTASSIREKRDKGSGSTFQWMMRLLMKRFAGLYDYWEGAENRYRKISKLQTGEIHAAILKWDLFVADRKSKLETAWPSAVNWLQKPGRRLPSVIPVMSDIKKEEALSLGILSGYRMIEKIEHNGSRELIKVLPIPIHQDVSESWIKNTLANSQIKS